MAEAPTKMQLGYWAIRGLAQPIRMALALGDVDFEDVRYPVGGAPDYDRSAWFNVKPNLGIDFCNLPYVIDGESSFAESVACLTYACQKAGIHKDFSMAEEAKALSLALAVQVLRNKAVGQFYGTWDGVKEEGGATAKYIQTATGFFTKFSKILKGKKYLMGDKLCSADFHLCEMIYQHYLLAPEIFSGDLNHLTKDYAAPFFAQPKIAKLEELKLPMNNMMAKFGAAYMEIDLTFPCI